MRVDCLISPLMTSRLSPRLFISMGRGRGRAVEAMEVAMEVDIAAAMAVATAPTTALITAPTAVSTLAQMAQTTTTKNQNTNVNSTDRETVPRGVGVRSSIQHSIFTLFCNTLCIFTVIILLGMKIDIKTLLRRQLAADKGDEDG